MIRKAQLLEIVPELLQRLELNGAHSHRARALNVGFLVIHEKRLGRSRSDSAQAVLVDGRIGLDEFYLGRECLMVKVLQPGELLPHMPDHVVGHIGEKPGPDSGGMNLLQPFHHDWIFVSPHLDIPLAK